MASELYNDHEIEVMGEALGAVSAWMWELMNFLREIDPAIDITQENPDRLSEIDWGLFLSVLKWRIRVLPEKEILTLIELQSLRDSRP